AARAYIDGCAVVRIGAADTVEIFVAHRFPDDGRAGVENLLHWRTIACRRWMRREPFRAAAAGTLTGDVIHVLDDRAQSGERPGGRSLERTRKIMRDEAAPIGLQRHQAASRILL